ncbi:Shugoshin [Cladobotryum mycophilum]|uniref:Shugoshin n=1 Tax=Cladobotryum mycophilum TaxID=491253 RepID=A0ABR0T0C7_9HYPO
MARLNELPVASDSLETLRKKMLRQNRDLAKSNNVRALRIRELENDCACMLSENLQLRGRILELEKQAEDNEARRIADHAMAIKARLEAQLTEWGTMIAGLGLEPPPKRHSPGIRRSTKQRISYSSCRPSPSQRRLRDVARDIEELGHISENKSYPRRSMNPEQILALRSEADISVDSPELGPPPMSQFIDEDPIKVDSPSRAAAERSRERSPEETPKAKKLEPPITLPSPTSVNDHSTILSPAKKEEQSPVPLEQSKSVGDISESPVQPIKTGSKRKLAARDDGDNIQPRRIINENDISRGLAEKVSVRQKLANKILKQDLAPKLEIDEKHDLLGSARKPLADKSTNDDISSPKKNSKAKMTAMDEATVVKTTTVRSKSSKPKSKNAPAIKINPIPDIEPPVVTAPVCDLAIPVTEPVLLSPNSPEPEALIEGPRGDTPPPADISSRGEVSRPSRRNRAAVSYAEPNLRDKMRRPTKELFDAVAGEGKYARRTSQSESKVSDSMKTKHEYEISDSSKRMSTVADVTQTKLESESTPTSPLAGKGLSSEDLPNTFVTERRKRTSNAVLNATELDGEENKEEADNTKDTSIGLDSSGLGDADVYEFNSSSPHISKEGTKGGKRNGRRQTTSSKRASTAEDDDEKDRNNSRRRSMMV